jgi:hypothetical protein
MKDDSTVSGLLKKREELSRENASLREQIAIVENCNDAIDQVLEAFDFEGDLEGKTPRAARVILLYRNELREYLSGQLRKASEPLSSRQLELWSAIAKGRTRRTAGLSRTLRDASVALHEGCARPRWWPAIFLRYALALENPPLHVACDTDRFRIVTAYTNSVPRSYDLTLEDILDSQKRGWLESAFYAPGKLKPGAQRSDLTKEAVDKFSTLVKRLQDKGYEPEQVGHFVNQLVFLFFAEDIGLLGDSYFRKVISTLSSKPSEAKTVLGEIFLVLKTGGRFGLDRLPWINGGLFDGRDALDLDTHEIGLLKAASSQDWGHIDPTIFGTLFERYLDPEKRAQIGAHYTDVDKKIIEPVVLRPLQEERRVALAEIRELVTKASKNNTQSRRYWREAEERRSLYLERLRNLSILDPACGSGNFLYIALREVKGIEHAFNQECEAFGLPPRWPNGPEILHRIELNPVAAELARTTIWIGDIQWGVQNGFSGRPEPILRPLNSIECRDALLSRGSERAVWPPAEFIIGNPPFLGAKYFRQRLGDEYALRLWSAFGSDLPGTANLVCYWFAQASTALNSGLSNRLGLVATNSITQPGSVAAIELLQKAGSLFEAWSKVPWILDGAAVEVIIVCATKDKQNISKLDGVVIGDIIKRMGIAHSSDFESVVSLKSNRGICYEGFALAGDFDISGDVARKWLKPRGNPNGKPNSDGLALQS